MLQQIWKLFERGDVPCEVEWVGTEPGEHTDIALQRRCSCLVVHRERQFATARQCANAALDRFPRSIAPEGLELKAKADLIVRRLKLSGIANACNGHPANDD